MLSSNYKNFIDGKWTASDKKSDIVDKYSQQIITQCDLASADQIERALNSASNATSLFAQKPLEWRVDKLKNLYRLIERDFDFFVQLIVQEAGKPKTLAKAEVQRSLKTLELGVSEVQSMRGETVPIDYGAGVGLKTIVERFPIGVVLAITPYNFPLNLLMHKLVPALALGCPLIIKPSVQAPVSSLELVKRIESLDFPAGFIQILNCTNEDAEILVRDSRVQKISFTGSDQVGWHLKSICGKKKITLELGGNASVIVDSSADISQAAQQLANASFAYAGQTCISTQKIFIHQQVYQQFKEKFLRETQKIKTGNPNQEDVIVGPLIDHKQYQKVVSLISEVKTNQTTTSLLYHDEQHDDPNHHIISPYVFEGHSDNLKICSEEAFGPVVVLEQFQELDQVVDLINQSRFGLQAALYSQNISQIKKAYQNLQVGALIVNRPSAFRQDNMPYGGIKDSGLGREGLKEALHSMSEPRLLVF